MQRLFAAITSCEARARCCAGTEQTLEECEAEMGPVRQMAEGLMEDSRLLQSGASSFNERAIESVEADVEACRPLLVGDAFLNSVIDGTVAEGESCGDGNAFDAAACRDDLICDLIGESGVCAIQTEENFVDRPSQTVEQTYCPRP